MEHPIVKPYPGMVITQSVAFEPGEYDFFGKDGIIVAADHVTIDGGGALLRGGYEKCAGPACSGPDNARELGFFGVGISLKGRAGVTLKNIRASGFDIGLKAERCTALTVSRCDFSGCFTDPAWGWDDHGFHGGILLEHVCGSLVEHCRAQGVWDALNMRFCDDNKVYGNSFSHTSDTGLKLWRCCRNEFNGNDFSYGIRIDPGEVHARDSSCVLIECGSNDNTFTGNDMTHGGDGLFVRVLNGWMSTGNTFTDNDCSYANNNAIEAWADGNSYIGNKANHSSYGFWLGGSDNTVIRGNEVAYNGAVNRNAPEAFGNAGISVVNASGCHVTVEGNHIHDNCGPGIAIRFLKDRPSFHWVIQRNVIANNRNTGSYKGHGIYAKNARFLVFGGNEITGNEGEGICFDANVSDVVMLDGKAGEVPEIKLAMHPDVVFAGEEAGFEAVGGAGLACRWDFGDGAVSPGSVVRHRYGSAGFYRVAATADNGACAAPAFRYVYVLPTHDTLDASAARWSVSGDSPAYDVQDDFACAVSGRSAVRIAAEGGAAHCARFPASGQLRYPLDGRRLFRFCIKYSAEAGTEWTQALRKPVVTLLQDDENFLRFTPDAGMLDLAFNPANEYKNNWRLVSLDMDRPDGWTVEKAGCGLDGGLLNGITFEYGNRDPGSSILWLDALCFTGREASATPCPDIAMNRYDAPWPRPIHSKGEPHSQPAQPLSGRHAWYGDGTPRFAAGGGRFYGVDFGCIRQFDRVDACFYHNLTDTVANRHEAVPDRAWLEVEREDGWREIAGTFITAVQPGRNRFAFAAVTASRVRVCFDAKPGRCAAIYGFSCYHTANLLCADKGSAKAYPASKREAMVTADAVEVVLNKQLNGNGSPLGDLITRVFDLDADGRPDRCLHTAVTPRDAVTPFAVTRIPVNVPGLQCNKRYALALGQTSCAKSREEGDYYRWVAGHGGYGECFGILSGTEAKPAEYDWGAGWLRVCFNGMVQDYSGDFESPGVRFGLEGIECRYMTFTVPDTFAAALDGNARGPAWRACDGDACIVEPEQGCELSGINIWLGGELPESLTVTCDGVQIAKAEMLTHGFNSIPFLSPVAKPVYVSLHGQLGSSEVYEIEALGCEPIAR